MRSFKTTSREQTIDLGERIVKSLPTGVNVILLDGNLSAGKTTMTKGIAKALGVKGIVNSPTFTILKTYQGDKTLYHMDLYRLDREGNDFDLEDYINDENGFCVIEWPHQVDNFLPNKYVEIKLTYIDDETRDIQVISYNINDEWENNI